MADGSGHLGVADVLITDELAKRPSRNPDYEAENRALGLLAQEMANNPRGVLQKCAELVMELCHADSAGISILEPGGASGILRWHAAAGAFAPHLHGTMPSGSSPCGTVIERNCVLLFNEAERFFPALRGVEPRIYENLLAPWHAKGEAVGTLWAIKHTPEGRFDAEDARVLKSVARFAAAAFQMISALDQATAERSALQESEERQAAELESAKALQTLSGLLITDSESGRLFEQIVDTAISIMRAVCGSIQLMDQERGELQLIASRNFSAKAEAYWQRVSVKTASTCGSALSHGERVVIENVATDERTRSSDNMDYWKSSGIVAVQSTPLTARDGTIIGMISTHWREPHVPDERELRLFDVLARQAADFIERTGAEEALRESEEKYRTLFESMSQGYAEMEIIRDADGRAVDLRWVELNPTYERLTGMSVAECLGRTVFEMIPDFDPWWVAEYDRIVRGGQPERVEYVVKPLDRWFEAHVYPQAGDRFTVLYEDITNRKRAEAMLRESEERKAFLLKLSDAVRPLADPAEIQGETTRLVREQLNAGWCYYVDWDLDRKLGLVLRDSAREGLPSLAGEHDVSDVPEFLQLLAEGAVLTVPDYASYEKLSTRIRQNFTALGFRSMMTAPLVKGGRLIASLLVGDTDTRDWSANDESLLVEVAERTWAAVGRARAEAALSDKEVRQAFLLKLSDALRPLTDAVQIQRTTARMLGEHLEADRVMFAEVGGDRGAETGTIRGQFTSQSATAFPEHFTFDQFGAHTMPARYRGESLVVANVETDPAFSTEERRAWIANGVCAAVVAALAKGGHLVAEFGVHSTGPRVWSDGEVALIEEVAERTWDAAERARAEAALRESEERLREREADLSRVQRVGGVGGIDIDVTGGLRGRRSPEYMRLHGLSPEQAEETHEDWLVRVHPDDRQQAEHAMFEALNGDASSYENEYRIIRPSDGQTRWIHARADIERNAKGKAVRIVGAHLDVTEIKQVSEALKASERHAQILLGELQHRVRNTLAVVRSIARRTADRSETLDEMVSHFEGRLNAFSRVQSAVTRNPEAGLSLDAIVEDELISIAAREGEQFRISGPEVSLRARPAESISLAIHELATNAVKYGALTSKDGRIKVSWDVRQADAGRQELWLEWVESGLDRKPAESHEGFGHEMLRRSLPYDLGAETDIRFTDDGMRFTMVLPLGPEVLAKGRA